MDLWLAWFDARLATLAAQMQQAQEELANLESIPDSVPRVELTAAKWKVNILHCQQAECMAERSLVYATPLERLTISLKLGR